MKIIYEILRILLQHNHSKKHIYGNHHTINLIKKWIHGYKKYIIGCIGCSTVLFVLVIFLVIRIVSSSGSFISSSIQSELSESNNIINNTAQWLQGFFHHIVSYF